jgi:hypothetical protein
MSWPPRTDPEAELEVVARALQAAAHAAPDSPRADEIRARLLATVPGSRRGSLFMPLAFAAAVLVLVLIVAVGAPAVGSLIRDLTDRTPSLPAPETAEPDDSVDVSVPMHTPDLTEPAPSPPSPIPTASHAAQEAGPPVPSAPAPGQQGDTSTPRPGGPPDPPPTGPPDPPPAGPPFPIPTPPATGPPSGVP